MIDFDTHCLDSTRDSKYGNIYSPDNFFTTARTTSCGNNFAIGYFSGESKEILDKVLDNTHKQSEKCDSLNALQTFNAIGAGTGSGFTSLLCNKLHEEFPDLLSYNNILWPQQNSNCVLEPYNTVLSMAEMTENINMVNIFDVDSIYKICQQNLSILKPTFADVNHIIGKSAVDVSSCYRFSGSQNTSMRKLAANLIPFPRSHFLYLSQYPWYTKFYDIEYYNYEEDEIIQGLFHHDNRMINGQIPINNENDGNRILSLAMVFRGKINAVNIDTELSKMKTELKSKF